MAEFNHMKHGNHFPWIRGNKPNYKKTDALINRKNEVVGWVEYAYGRSDSADSWTIWDVKVRIPNEEGGVAFTPHTSQWMNYTEAKKMVTYEIMEYFNKGQKKIPLHSTECGFDEEAYGTCVTLNSRVLYGAPQDDEIYTVNNKIEKKYFYNDHMKKYIEENGYPYPNTSPLENIK